ncbi:hypothetical protein [Nitrincola sp. MINF-07-Sa-05]|uniref:hypothetical protein n=1 Tax=Nitrincola salilacus TaxID=3400273 RepID=UPI003917F4C7
MNKGVLLSSVLMIGMLAWQTVSADSARDETNLLSSDIFETHATGVLDRPWRASQHSSHPSYNFGVEDGVVTIERYDFEPWGQISQRIDARPFAGKTLEFSAELAGEFNLEFGEEFEPTGLGVVLHGVHEDPRYRMMGSMILKTPNAALGATEGVYDWTPLSVSFEVPENATTMDISVLMALGGKLKARNPRLRLVSE